MISTSSYDVFKDTLYLTTSISGDRGSRANYNGNYYSELAPKRDFWNVWHNNIGKISEEENNRFYIEQYYKEVLSKLDPEEVYNDLKYSTLLCYEKNNEFCHRHVVSAWLELMLDIKVPEVDEKFNEVERPEYIKKLVEEVIKNNINLFGFNSVRAAYLYQKSEKYDQIANELELNNQNSEEYRQLACYLRCDADEVESNYNHNKLVLQ